MITIETSPSRFPKTGNVVSAAPGRRLGSELLLLSSRPPVVDGDKDDDDEDDEDEDGVFREDVKL